MEPTIVDDVSDKYANFSHDELVAEINRLKKHKKYGLVWEHKTEKVIEDFETQQPYLEEVTDKRIEDAPGEPTNLIIEGDNFEALSILNYTHAGKVDVIYIDPPYNTGNKDFIYNDNYVDSEDEFRHSKWLSFMEPRLKLAKNLLKDDGVIFISIDDNEQAALKMLCDEVFGQDNLVACVINQSANSVYGSKAASKNRTYIKVKDYVLVYKNQGAELNLQPLYSPARSYLHDSHDFIYENGKQSSTADWFSANYGDIFRKYGLRINKASIQKLLEFDDDFRTDALNRVMNIQYRTVGNFDVTKLSEDEKAEIAKGNIIEHDGQLLYAENENRTSIGTLRPLSESCQEIDGEVRKCEILGDIWNTSSGYQNINAEGGVRFKNGKKPIVLIENVLKSINSRDAIVVDFFAGSGTTGHAVIDLNSKDGGKRKFILCTNNEGGIAEEITYKRIKNVVEGYGNNDGIPANLRYYKIDHIEKKQSIDANRLEIVRYLEDIIQVKENSFEQCEVDEDFALYKNSERFVGMVFDPFALEEAIGKIKERNAENLPVKLYVFSYSRDAFEDDYETDFEIEFVAMPEGLLKTYANIVAETKKEDA